MRKPASQKCGKESQPDRSVRKRAITQTEVREREPARRRYEKENQPGRSVKRQTAVSVKETATQAEVCVKKGASQT